MNTLKKDENNLMTKIIKILNEFQDFEKPFVNKEGDIIIKKKFTVKKSNQTSILTNIFKETIKNDLKKNRV